MRIELMDGEARRRAEITLRNSGIEKGGIRSIIGKAKRLAGHMLHTMTHTTNPEGYGMGEIFVNFSQTPLNLENPEGLPGESPPAQGQKR